jgi:cytochrome c biogenesis protein CcmG, thiol:disulfide interchange protein DsbE
MSTSKTKAARKREAQRKAKRRNTIVVVAVVVLVIAAAALGAMLLTGGEDGDARPATADVDVTGESLEPLGEDADPAVGALAPELAGQDFDGAPVTVTHDEGPQAVLFVAHWCPVCQDEIRNVQEWVDAGEAPEEVRIVTVSTGVDQARPNYPPAEWLEGEGWSAPVIADDAQGSAARAYGLPAYPFFVFLDAQGNVVGRHAGAIPVEQLGQIMEQLAGM